MINEDYVYARKEDEEFFVDGFRVAGLPVCMTAEEIGQFPALKPRPECEAERAKAWLRNPDLLGRQLGPRSLGKQ